MTLLITGGAGFIGSNFIIDWLAGNNEPVVNLDSLTYAGNLQNLRHVENDPRYCFVRGDIGDSDIVARMLREHTPRAIINFAAESHVDRSIAGPEAFVQTNMVGTFRLLEAARQWQDRSADFRFLHVSTDEVYGTLGPDDAAFSETSQIAPNSPYSASKAASDHLARSYFHTYGLPVLISNCSNNYGPFQFPEKLIPLCILNALAGKPLPIYGDGMQIRDWLYVGDHCSALRAVLDRGRPGEVYNIGGGAEKTNLDTVRAICAILDREVPVKNATSYAEQIEFVRDRPGHDRRYAVNCSKIQQQLGWSASESFQSGFEKTVRWYLANQDWTGQVTSGAYRDWIKAQYA